MSDAANLERLQRLAKADQQLDLPAGDAAAVRWALEEIQRQATAIDELECTVSDEEAAHQETVAMLEGLRVRLAAVEAQRDALRKASQTMLDLEARRMFEHDMDDDAKVRPCPCPGCDALRAALEETP